MFEERDVASLVGEARRRALVGDATSLLPQLDDALASATSRSARGQLLLARAIALQGGTDPSLAARDAEEALRLLEKTKLRSAVAYTASVAAVLCQQSGRITDAVDHAVTSMVARAELTDGDPDRVRAANALAVLFLQLSSFELAERFSTEAFIDALEDETTAVIAGYTHCFIVVEAIHGGIAVPIDMARRAARWMAEETVGDAPRTVIGPGMLVELTLLGEYVADVEELTATMSSHLDAVSPRIRAWAELVCATVARRTGDPRSAVALLDSSIPVLGEIGDEHRLVRAHLERSEALDALGRPRDAFHDAREAARLAREQQLQLVGRLSGQIERRADLEIARAALRRRADDLAQEASIDALTGVGSRRWIESLLDGLVRQDGDGAVVVLDLDHFKSVNDRFGHHAGDLTLSAVGKILRRIVRGEDSVGRLGGEEFVVIAPGSPSETAVSLAERIRREIEEAPWWEIDPELRVTTSAGVAHGPLSTIRDVVRAADAALYDAKDAGRNRVVEA